MIETFIVNLLASSLVMKRNLDWHRRLLMFALPLFFIFMLLQTMYLVAQLNKTMHSGG